MDKQQLLKMAGNPALIPGIYNYCDRWCERCPLTSYCLVFAMEAAEKPTADAGENELGAAVEAMCRLSLEILDDLEKECGAGRASDARAIPDEMRARPLSEGNSPSPPGAGKACQVVLRSARHYIDLVNDWFASHGSLFQEKERSLNATAAASPNLTHPQLSAHRITDAVEVIRWYQYLIFVKLTRASENMKSLSKESTRRRRDDDIADVLRQDMDGSAKVALIGIQRCINAWLSLRSHLKDQADSILHVLIHLEKLRRNMLTVFPGAETFVRPGFDEIERFNRPGGQEDKE